MNNSRYSLWHIDGKLFDFNTDDEIINYLNEHNIDYRILAGVKGYYISIIEPRYFVMPDLLYFLQGEPHE